MLWLDARHAWQGEALFFSCSRRETSVTVWASTQVSAHERQLNSSGQKAGGCCSEFHHRSWSSHFISCHVAVVSSFLLLLGSKHTCVLQSGLLPFVRFQIWPTLFVLISFLKHFLAVGEVFNRKSHCINPALSLSSYRMLRVLHQVSGRGALRLPGGHHPLLLRRGSVLRLRPRGADRHPDHAGEPLLLRHQRPCHPHHGVSSRFGSDSSCHYIMLHQWN